ncbi:MAG: hypothetical protein RIS88_1775 [Pseudomonadota bacterium]
MACAPGVFSGLHHLAGGEQLQVQGCRELRVIEPRLPRPQRVFVAPKQRQAVCDEVFQRLQRLLAGDGPAKALQAAGVIREARSHQGQHRLRGRIGRETQRRAQAYGPLLAEGFAVVGVEVPLAARRRIAVHQDAVLLAQGPVPVFQPQLLAPLGVLGKLAHRAEEMAVVADVQRQGARGGGGAQRLQHAPIARRGHDQALRLHVRDRAVQLSGQRAGVACIVQVDVVDRPLARAQRLREVPHATEKQRDARLGGGHMRGLLGDLRHPHPVLRRIEAVKGAGLQVQLVAQHDHEMAARHRVSFKGGGRGMDRCRGESTATSRQSTRARGSWGTCRNR